MSRIVPSCSTILDWYFDWCVAHAHDKQCDLQRLLQSKTLLNWYTNMLKQHEPSVTRLMLNSAAWEQRFLWDKQRERLLFRYPKIILKHLRKLNTN